MRSSDRRFWDEAFSISLSVGGTLVLAALWAYFLRWVFRE